MVTSVASAVRPRRSPAAAVLAIVGWAMILAAGAFLTLVFFLLLLGPDDGYLWGAAGVGALVALGGGLLAFRGS